MKNVEFQLVKNLLLSPSVLTEQQFIQALRSEKMRLLIEPVRLKFSKGEHEEASKLKKMLPAVLLSGAFEGGRKLENLKGYSGIVCLDLDKVADDKLQQLKEKASDCEYTFIAFVSPSGKGLKILVKVSTEAAQHKIAYSQVVRHYSELLNEKFDEATNDVTRLTYLSYDPDFHYCPSSKVFPVAEPVLSIVKSRSISNKVKQSTVSADFSSIRDVAYRYTSKKVIYEEGTRNTFLYTYANHCNRLGMPEENVFENIEWCNLPPDEIERTITSAYKHTEEFGIWQDRLCIRSKQELPSQNEFTKAVEDSFCFGKPLMHGLPDLFANALSGYHGRQRDMAFVALLSFLSGLMHNTQSVHDGAILYPALNTVITAPSASGKSVTGVMQSFFLPLHEMIRNERNNQFGLFLPDNTTTSTLIARLSGNDGIGIMFSTDMGFHGHSMKHDLNGLRAIFRSNQSGELFSNGRSLKKDISTVKTPRMASCFCATPLEFQTFFPSREDGLFSRFLHYSFTPDLEWKRIEQGNVVSVLEKRNRLSKEIIDMRHYLSNKSFEFRLLSEQWLSVNDWLENEYRQNGFEGRRMVMDAVIKRMPMIILKISMVFATLRAWESKSEEPELELSESDFKVVMNVSRVFFEHASALANYIPTQCTNRIDDDLEKFYNLLPESFQRKEAIGLYTATGVKASPRTIDDRLSKLVGKQFLKREGNVYRKITDVNVRRTG